MKFYDREYELQELKRIRQLAFADHSHLTVVTGRRRIGKTSLIMKSVEQTPTVYLFVSRRNEAALCAEFVKQISSALGVYLPGTVVSFADLFRTLLELATTRSFNLVIDEFQEFFNINESIYSDMQNYWDQYRLRTKMNLIVSGSIYSLMNKIFRNYKEPLFGRADHVLKLQPFSTDVLKLILHDHFPAYTNDDLLAFYTFTGGIPKYIESFCDNGIDLSVNSMIDFMVCENSSFLDEGKTILIEEFGKNYGVYFSILSALSGGINTQQKIEAALGNKNLGGHLKRLMEDYDVIKRCRPILAKAGGQTVRYEITDNFLAFWFNYFDRNRSLIELRNYEALAAIIRADYPTYSGHALERYFRQRFIESHEYRDMGAYWEMKKGREQCEIDIVALRLEKNKAVAVEVKRQRKEFKPALFAEKVQHLKDKVLPKYDIEQRCLTLEDM